MSQGVRKEEGSGNQLVERSVKAWGKVTQYKAKAKLYSIKN